MVQFQSKSGLDTSGMGTKARPSAMVSKIIVAEEDSDDEQIEDIIPGPTSPEMRIRSARPVDTSRKSLGDLGDSSRGTGGLASRKDLNMPADEFAMGCKLLQQAALGNQIAMDAILKQRPNFVNFRDYDRRTALHVAASEGHLQACKYLIEKGASVNRSDRWGGSPLDDAHRHRHKEVVQYLLTLGAKTGSTDNLTKFINAAAEGDVDEIKLLMSVGDIKVDDCDYDKRTALHLAAGEGQYDVVKLLCESGASVNFEDRWGGRPLDDAVANKHKDCIDILKKFGALEGKPKGAGFLEDSSSRRREVANLEVNFEDLEMVDRIGKGSFGEIYKCRWRGTLVAAKIIKSARIRSEWVKARALEKIAQGGNVDDAIEEMDEAEMAEDDKKAALEDFRREISVLKSLRHPNIVLLLAYSATENLEVMISELMVCSLLDIFKAHIVHGTKMKKKDQIIYATHLAQGMLYLHTCRPPIIHRDLKPANLLVDKSGVLKVADFGLSKVRPDPKKEEQDTFLMTGETGSYRFMAPEVYRHQHYTETVDVYSYGMILFYLLDGKPPWPYENGLVAVKKASEEHDRPALPRHWDQRLQSLLQECWNDNPTVRPPFNVILRTLSEYARDVFHADSESLLPDRPDKVTKGCGCVLM